MCECCVRISHPAYRHSVAPLGLEYVQSGHLLPQLAQTHSSSGRAVVAALDPSNVDHTLFQIDVLPAHTHCFACAQTMAVDQADQYLVAERVSAR
jgi:hypothetical protein